MTVNSKMTEIMKKITWWRWKGKEVKQMRKWVHKLEIRAIKNVNGDLWNKCIFSYKVLLWPLLTYLCLHYVKKLSIDFNNTLSIQASNHFHLKKNYFIIFIYLIFIHVYFLKQMELQRYFFLHTFFIQIPLLS